MTAKTILRRGLALALAAGLLSSCAGEAVPERRQPPPIDRAAPQTSFDRETRQCLADLSGTGARFSPLPNLSAGTCSSRGAVSLSAISGDDAILGVTHVDRVACPAALTFAGWARYGVDRAATQILGSPVSRVETFGSYSCRNVAGTGRLSAHGSAEAIDISAFVLGDGRRVTVKDGWNGSAAERRFLRTVYASACKRFGTVLGPDYNAAHHDHLHVERSGGGFCR